MIDISTFLRVTSSIDKVPTHSAHKNLIRSGVANVIANHPEYLSLIKAIIIFPVQHWASLARKRVDLGKLIFADYDASYEYFGIQNIPDSQKRILSLTEQSLQFVEEMLVSEHENINMDVIRAAHYPGSPDMSQYMFSWIYEESLNKLCELYKEPYDEIARALKKEYTKIKEDIRFVYHESDFLIKLKTRLIMAENDSQIKDSDKVNYGEAVKCIDKCIDVIKTYENKGEEISIILKMRSDRVPEKIIVENTGRSRTYIKARYEDGVELLNYLLWGYSAKDVIKTYF